MKKCTIVTSICMAAFILSACGGKTDTTNSTKKDDTGKNTTKTVESNTNDTTEETTEKVSAKEIELVDSGYSVSEEGDYIYWCAVIKNPDEAIGYEFHKIIITAYDSEGSVLANEEQTMNIIAPGETQAFGSLMSTNGGVPDKVEFSVESGDAMTGSSTYIPSAGFEAIDANERKDPDYEDEVTFTGKIKNKTELDCESVCVVLVLKKDGKIVYGNDTFIDNLKAGQEKAFEINEYNLPEYDSYEISAIDWS